MRLSLALATAASALDNGVGLTPPMGWLSWERFACQTNCKDFPDKCINEDLYKAQADKLVELGLLELGYNRVNVDDCWALKSRDAQGNAVPDPARFPSGMKALGDYLHERQLLFGQYTDIGTMTCGGYPGLQGHMQRDIDQMVSWGIDSLKVDGCYWTPDEQGKDYIELGKVLNATGRPILYSCSWPAYLKDHGESVMETMAEHCNLWRNYADISDSWDSLTGIINYWKRTDPKQPFVSVPRPGAINDADMLIIGNQGLSLAAERTQFALWAVFASPLYISSDLRTISQASLDILKNKDIIAVNQDPAVRQGWCALNCDKATQLWIRPLANGDFFAVFWNSNTFGNGSLYAALTLTAEIMGKPKGTAFTARNLYTKENHVASSGEFSAQPDLMDVVAVRVSFGQAEVLV